MVLRRLTLILALTGLLFCLSTPDATAQVAVRLSEKTITVRGQQYLIHRVRKGEMLYAIAKAYAVSQEDIMQANSLTRDVLRNRQTLLIPVIGSHQRPADEPQQEEERPEPQMEKITPSIPRYTIEQKSGQHEPTYVYPDERQTVIQHDTIHIVPGEPLAEDFGNGALREIDKNAPLQIGVLLPLQPGNRNNERFSEFYKGMLLGLNALRAEGISANVQVMNSGGSEGKVREVINTGKLDKCDLVIGPVYAEAFAPMAQFAAQQHIAVVSPLGAVAEDENPYVFEAAPADERTYQHIFEQYGGRSGSISADANLVVIDHVEHADSAILSQIETNLGEKVSTLSFTGVRSQSQAMNMRLNAALDKERLNIIYVPVSRQDAVEGILSHLSSLNITGRYRIMVIGTPRWEWLSNLNLDLFYKLDVHYPASYHADRSHPAVEAFYREYLSAFNEVPTPYSFRGYDVIRYFGGALKHFGADMPNRIANQGYDPQLLQVGYDFRQMDGAGKYRNIAWPIVHYKPNYTIEVIR